ncbi:Ras-related protein RABG1 [Cardamine amara subsp. amara]|uniref:Ras-related protein RABG1 n=1 Tax=Cardamine amara subsp. amara TaxID=228776 RepID=A0ABD1AUU0_CARAN
MNSWKKPTKLKIILLGDSGVGKTSLVKRYHDKDFKELHLSTVGIDLLDKELCIENKLVSLQIWDTAGQERFKGMPSAFYRDTHCCVLVYDVNVLQTFESLDNWHAEFIKMANPITPDKFPFVLMGNKTDVKDGKSRVVEKEKAVEWCNSKGEIVYFETSAKEKINVDEAFLEIARKALSNERRNNEIYTSNIEIVEEQPKRCAC